MTVREALPWLVTVPAGLGDAIQAMVAVERLHRLAGRGGLTLACTESLVPLLRDLAGVHRVVRMEEGYGSLGDGAFEWAVDLASLGTSRAYCNGLNARHRSYHDFYTIPLKSPGGHHVVVDRARHPAKFFDPLGTGRASDPHQPAWTLEAQVAAAVAGEDIEGWIRAGLEPRLRLCTPHHHFHLSNPAQEAIVLAPCGSLPVKRWPEDRWLALAELLAQQGAPVCAVIGPWEHGIPTLSSFPGHVFVFRDLDSRELAAVLGRARVVVANDSGPMHLAASLDRPTLALFGPTNPRCWFTYCGPHRRFLQSRAFPDAWGNLNGTDEWTHWPSVEEVHTEVMALLATRELAQADRAGVRDSTVPSRRGTHLRRSTDGERE